MAVRLSDQIIRRLTVGVDTQQINGVRLTNQPHPTYDLYVKGNTLHNGIIYVANGTTYYINNSADSRLRDVNVRTLGITQTDGDVGYGISLYSGPVTNNMPTYGIAFAHTSKFGKLENNNSKGINSDWATYLTMSDTPSRGWIFRRGSTDVAGIDGRGTFITTANTASHINGLTGESVAINMTAAAGYLMLARIKSTSGRFNLGVYNNSFDVIYGADTITSNTYTYSVSLLGQNGISYLRYLLVDGANHMNSTAALTTVKLIYNLANTQSAIGQKLEINGTSYFKNSLVIAPNIRAIEFRPDHASYASYIYYGTSGNEALNFVNRQAVTSFIFWTGNSVNGSAQWYQNESGAARTDNPALQIKNNCVYINKLLPHDTNPAYNLFVNGSAKIDKGSLQIYPVGGNYNDGIRIHARSSDNSWAAILLCGADQTGDTGTSTNSWFIGNQNGTFWVTRNGSAGSSAGYLKATTSNSKGYWEFYHRLGINGIKNDVEFYVNGTSYFVGNVQMAATTESTSATTGTLRVDGGVGIAKDMNARSLARNGDSMILAPGGGYFKDGAATKTGALKITLPQAWTSTMLSFLVDIYDYSDNSLTTYHIGGYNYTGSGGSWVNCSATCTGTGNKTNLTVRFCYDGTKCCITIGETNTVWNYPKISIRNVNVGHSNDTIEKWRTGWGVSWVTSLPTVKVTKSNTSTVADGTAGRIAWYKTYNQIAAANIKTDGSFLRNIGGYENNSYALSAASAIINDWIRTTGSTGWYSQSHGGGWYMSDDTWIRSYGNKSIYQNAGTLRTDGDFWADYVHIDDNWLGVYSAKGSGTRYGYMQIDRENNKVWRFVKEQGGVFTFNNKVLIGVTSIPTTAYGTQFEIRAGDLNNDSDWQFAIKNQHNANATGWGVGIKLANGGEAETGKWAGIRGSTWSAYSNSTSLDLYASAARRLRLVDNELLPNAANTQSLGNKNYYYHHVHCRWLRANVPGAGDDGGITLYSESSEYSIMFRTTANQGKHGSVSGDWATYFMMNNQNNRGWIFKRWGSYCVASISTQGQFWIGRNDADSVERQIGINNASHNFYMYITNAGVRGLYSAQGGNILQVTASGNNNRVYFADSYNHTNTALAYSQSGIVMHRANIQTGTNTGITWFTAWNGYELRAISQDYVFQRYQWWTSGNGLKVDNLRGGVTFAYTNHGSPPTTGTIAAFDCANNANYTLQIMGQYNGIRFYFRNRNGDNGSWKAWRQVLTTDPNTAKGNANRPIYIDADGSAIIIGHDLKSHVNASTATYLAYYSGNDTISGTANLRIVDGALQLRPNNGSYREGLRIYPTGSWATIVLGGNDLSAASGTSGNSWSIHNNNGNFYINKNNSSGAQGARAWATSTGWTFGNTSRNSYALNAASFICDSWVRTVGSAGWYSESYGGGWYMSDTTWIRTYNNKSVYSGSGVIRSDAGTWGCKVYLTDNWVGFYSGNGGGTRYGYIQCNASRMYFRKENGVSGYHFDFQGDVWVSGKSWHAVWNDYAECRTADTIEPGRCVTETASGVMTLSTERLQAGCKLTSDTFGSCMGETETAKTPIAVAGRVLVYPYRNPVHYQLGAAVCSAPNGTVDIMSREEIMMYPERILGTISEIPNYEIWQGGSIDDPHPIEVNGRIWVYVR